MEASCYCLLCLLQGCVFIAHKMVTCAKSTHTSVVSLNSVAISLTCCRCFVSKRKLFPLGNRKMPLSLQLGNWQRSPTLVAAPTTLHASWFSFTMIKPCEAPGNITCGMGNLTMTMTKPDEAYGSRFQVCPASGYYYPASWVLGVSPRFITHVATAKNCCIDSLLPSRKHFLFQQV